MDGERRRGARIARRARGSRGRPRPPDRASAPLVAEDETKESARGLEDHKDARESVYFNMQDPASGLRLVATLGVRRADAASACSPWAARGTRAVRPGPRPRHGTARAIRVGGAATDLRPRAPARPDAPGPHEAAAFPPGPLAPPARPAHGRGGARPRLPSPRAPPSTSAASSPPRSARRCARWAITTSSSRDLRGPGAHRRTGRSRVEGSGAATTRGAGATGAPRPLAALPRPLRRRPRASRPDRRRRTAASWRAASSGATGGRSGSRASSTRPSAGRRLAVRWSWRCGRRAGRPSLLRGTVERTLVDPGAGRPAALAAPGRAALRPAPPRELRALGGAGPGGPWGGRAVGAAAMSEATAGIAWVFELRGGAPRLRPPACATPSAPWARVAPRWSSSPSCSTASPSSGWPCRVFSSHEYGPGWRVAPLGVPLAVALVWAPSSSRVSPWRRASRCALPWPGPAAAALLGLSLDL